MKKASATFFLSMMLLPQLAHAEIYEMGIIQKVTTEPEAYCREYTRTVTVGGVTQNAYGTACMQPDGSWKIKGMDQSGEEENVQEVVRYVTRERYYIPDSPPTFYPWPLVHIDLGYFRRDKHWRHDHGYYHGKHGWDRRGHRSHSRTHRIHAR